MDIAQQQLFNRGTQAHESGNLTEAESCYRAVLAQLPNAAEVYNLLGVLLSQKGQLAEAICAFEAAVENDSNNTNYRFNLAVSLQSKGEPRLAAEHYVNILNLRPDHRQSLYNLSIAYQAVGAVDIAIAGYERVIALDSSDPRPFFNLGTALRSYGKPAEAISFFKEALRRTASYPEAYNNLGVAWLEVGENEKALVAFQKALIQNPDYAEAYFNIHALYVDKADIDSAIQALQNAVRIRASEPKYQFFLGVLLHYSGKALDAEKCFHQVQKANDALWISNLDAWMMFSSDITINKILVGTGLKIFTVASMSAPKQGALLEFGVRFGTSIRILSDLNCESELHGFDSFEGLPEAWHNEPKGSYTTGGVLPKVPSNVTLHRGWFDKTLPEYLQTSDKPIKIVNIDCDIYSSTKTVLNLLADKVDVETVVIFDELIGNQHWRADEFKALEEWAAENKIAYKFLAMSFYTKQAVIQIVSVSR